MKLNDKIKNTLTIIYIIVFIICIIVGSIYAHKADHINEMTVKNDNKSKYNRISRITLYTALGMFILPIIIGIFVSIINYY